MFAVVLIALTTGFRALIEVSRVSIISWNGEVCMILYYIILHHFPLRFDVSTRPDIWYNTQD